jgi:hypothetical protein
MLVYDINSWYAMQDAVMGEFIDGRVDNSTEGME